MACTSSASIYSGDGYVSGEILTGGEESEFSDADADLEDEEPLFQRGRKSHSSWHTPKRQLQRNREARFSGISRTSAPRKQLPSGTRVTIPQNQPQHPPSTSSTDSQVMGALTELTNSLNRLVDRLDKQENRLATIEDKLSSTPSSGSSSSPDCQKKAKVPLPIRSEVRRMYKALMEDKEDFAGFDTSKGVTFNDTQNADVLKTLLREVSSANPSFQASHIRAAVYTYYRTLCAEDSLKRRGKLVERNKTRRRKERTVRKLQGRISAMAKSSMLETEKRKWQSVLTAEFMSSEESNSDSENGVIIKRQLPWRSERVSRMFAKLDSFVDEGKSAFAKRQTRQRILCGSDSQRDPPSGKYPSWAVQACSND